MIDVTHVYKGLRDNLEKHFSKIGIEKADEKCQKRRSFYIDFLNSIDEKIAPSILKTAMTFNIIYFAEKDYKSNLELLRIQRKLLFIFTKPLKVTVNNKEFYIYLEGITFKLDEGDFTLTMNFDVEISQVITDKVTLLDEFGKAQEIDFENLFDDENYNNEFMDEITTNK